MCPLSFINDMLIPFEQLESQFLEFVKNQHVVMVDKIECFLLSVCIWIFPLHLNLGMNSLDNNSVGYDMGWWKEEHFNASDADGDGFLNITEFNE